MRALAAIGSVHTSMPSTHTCPRSGRSKPVAMRSVVVFPAPFGPTMPKKEPRGTSTLISATAIFGPNAFANPRTASAGHASPVPVIATSAG